MTLKDVLEEISAEEYALPANAPAHRFSRKHRRAIQKVFYPEKLPKTEKRISIKRRAVLIAAVVVLAVITGAAASFYHYNGFAFHKGYEKYVGKYYIMLAENRKNAPETIEKIIYDDNVPEEFTFEDTYTGVEKDKDKFVQNRYFSTERINKFGKKGAFFNIEQCSKWFFVDPITDDCTVTPVEVKGCKGFTIATEEALNVVIWDSGDYIHVVNGTLSVEELLEIAENMTEK